ncbi:MAG: hypothetical protein ABI402_18110 [Ferruginibacter sp.]
MYKVFLLLILLTSCKFHDNKGRDVKAAEALLKKNMPLYDSCLFILPFTNPDSVIIVRKILIEKFNKIYKLDTANLKIGDYLSQLYYEDKNYEKAIFWDYHQPDCSQNDSVNIGSYMELSYCYLLNGEIDSGKIYIQKAIKAIRYYTPYSETHFLIELREIIYDIIPSPLTNLKEINLLRLKKIPVCLYAKNILDIMLSYVHELYPGERDQFESDPFLLQLKKSICPIHDSLLIQ